MSRVATNYCESVQAFSLSLRPGLNSEGGYMCQGVRDSFCLLFSYVHPDIWRDMRQSSLSAVKWSGRSPRWHPPFLTSWALWVPLSSAFVSCRLITLGRRNSLTFSLPHPCSVSWPQALLPLYFTNLSRAICLLLGLGPLVGTQCFLLLPLWFSLFS